MYYATYTPFENLILNILAILVIIIFGGALYAFLSAIFLFIFSKGNKEKIEKAMNSLRYMILGIFLSLLLLFGFPILAQKLQLPGYKIYTAQNIFNKASYLIKTIFFTISGSYKGNIYNNPGKKTTPSTYELDTSL